MQENIMQRWMMAFLILMLPLLTNADDSITIKFAEKIARYELPLPSEAVDQLLVSSKAKNEWTFIIRMGPVTKRTIATCNSSERKGKFSDVCDVQVGQIVNPVFPTTERRKAFVYL